MLTSLRYKLFAILCLAVLGSGNSFGQNQSTLEGGGGVAPQLPTAMVMLHVRVTDAMSHAVVDVPQGGFKVFEDGIEQKIALFSKEQVPVSYGLVVDNSGSLRRSLSQVVRAGIRIVKSNKTEDDAFLIRFISSDKIEVVQEPTSDGSLLMKGLDGLYVEGGSTAVVDAVYLAADKLARRPSNYTLRRRALVLVTDGEDRNSFYKREHLFSLLASTDIQIYAIGFTDHLPDRNRERARDLLSQLATDTGGRAFFPSSAADLEQIADEIINDIRTQYIIGYAPSGTDGSKSFHKVVVSVANDLQQQKRVAVTRFWDTHQSRSNRGAIK